jgi:2-methylcitrate dehydratase PrpD
MLLPGQKIFWCDWFGSAIAGKGSRPVETITQFAQQMGGFDASHNGPSEILISRKTSSPFLAAMANAAASHVAEQDDVHNGSVFHPATVVFPGIGLRTINWRIWRRSHCCCGCWI